MEILGQSVHHATFGEGVITELKGSNISVTFTSRSCRFEYPDAFEKFLRFEDEALQAGVIREITEKKAAKIARREEAQRRVEVEAVRETAHTAITRRVAIPRRANLRVPRVQGECRTFYVFQGTTFEKECRSGYIWAPIYNRNGGTQHH